MECIPKEVANYFEKLLLNKPFRILQDGKIIEVYPIDHSGDTNEMMDGHRRNSSPLVVGDNPAPK